MTDKIKLWCFILLLPFVAAIGHDIWASMYKDENVKVKVDAGDIEAVKSFEASDFGYLFVTYTPELYDSTRKSVGEETWVKWVDPVMQLYTFVVALFPLGVFAAWLVIARVFDIWPFSKGIGGLGKKDKESRDVREDRNKGANFKYKRK